MKIVQAALIATTALAACETAPPAPDGAPVYDCVETRLLDGDLVNFRVAMRNATHDDVTDYAECAAAQYALIRGYGFARHVRTSVSDEAGIWTGDAVYTISAALPAGLRSLLFWDFAQDFLSFLFRKMR